MQREIPEGAEVTFFHGRRVDGRVGTWYRSQGERGDLNVWTEEGLAPSPRGGHTTCQIKLPDGSEVVGVAECSQLDNYSKKIGRNISLGRALKRLETE